MRDINDFTLTAAQIASLLMLSTERVRQLVNTGYIPRIGKAKYPVTGAVQGYIRFLKDEEKRAFKSVADDKLKAARQREVELRIAEREGRVVDMEDVEAFYAFSMTTFRAELNGIPASVTRDRKLREAIETAIDGAISRYQRRFVEAGEALRAGRDPLGTDGEDDT